MDAMRADAAYDRDEDAAVVIVGQAIQRGCKAATTSAVTLWWAWSDNDFQGNRTFLANQAGCVADGQGIAYNVLKVRPGRYQMNLLEARPDGRVCQSNFLGYVPWSQPSYNDTPAPKFMVGKGEVIYVGDIVFSEPCGAKMAEIGRNDAAARAALARFEKFRAEIAYRPLIVAGQSAR